ncbi:RIMS-binding protein 2-like [Schistocerca cancellata]|uniref:RIMS-binding protein 2-like n=1 Tax=Schistocerca cancellata TaxID=274614 RepID=UPI00211887AC|nr:RIMS-binding protein 2-like [Schistocerca cancellata]
MILLTGTIFTRLQNLFRLPDPPVDIQVEPGPQDGTLLVTWLPVTINTTAPVTGYAVYADGKKVTDVDSPTGDHALIDVNKLLGLNPKQVTVRTKSRDSQSTDSVPTPIPSSALKGKTAKESAALESAKADRDRRQRERYGSAVPPHMRHHQQSSGHRQMRIDSHGQVVIEPEENLSDKEIYPANNMNIPLIGKILSSHISLIQLRYFCFKQRRSCIYSLIETVD